MKKASNGRAPKNNRKAKSAAAGDVRIIGGQFKRRIVSFIDADGLRPTPDRLRETLFNWLLADIHDAHVLDSCAGSGVLGFEALSRGAAHTTFIEINPAQSNMLRQSAEQLRLEAASYQIITGTAEQVLRQEHLTARPFDIVFIDPPYAQDLWQPILTALITNALINTETLIYLEADKDLSAQLKQLEA
ncbi:MAG: 16S rRNA (guanine(966)-N(2))-methyltransferase RsmD, partial [Psychrobacter sp.]